MTDKLEQLSRRMATGAIWMVAVRLIDRAAGIVSMLVLARLLTPEDFGLVAIATSLIAILEIWSYFGFDAALIRDQNATRTHYDTAWTLTFLRGLGVAFLVLSCSSVAANFFQDERIEGIMLLLSAISILDGTQSIRTVDFRKHLKIRKEFQFTVTARLVQVIVTMTLAYIWRDYWALVVGIMVSSFVKLVLSYAFAPYKPAFTLQAFGDLFSFSKWMMINSILNFITTRLDTFVIGRFSGASSVGIYQMGYEISNMATTELVWPISRAVYPGFAMLSDSKSKLEASYNQSLGIMVLIALPIAAGIGFTAEYFIPLLLGTKWVASIPLIQVLSVYGALRVIVGNTGSLYAAINRPYMIAVFGASNLLVLVPLMLWWVQVYGATGVAWAVVISNLPTLFLMFWMNSRLAGIRASTTIKYMYRPLSAVMLMALTLLVLRTVMPAADNFEQALIILATTVAVGITVYITSVIILRNINPKEDDVEVLVIRHFFSRRSSGSDISH